MAKVTAISSLGWAHYTLYEALPAMAKLGFDRIDISSFKDYCFHFNFGSPTPTQLNEMLDERSIKVICVNYAPELYYAWQNDVENHFAHAYEAKMAHLSAVGIPMMVMHFGLANDRKDVEDQMSKVVKASNRVGKIAETYNIRMLIEVPHMYGLLSSLEQVKWVVGRLESSNIGVLVDSLTVRRAAGSSDSDSSHIILKGSRACASLIIAPILYRKATSRAIPMSGPKASRQAPIQVTT